MFSFRWNFEFSQLDFAFLISLAIHLLFLVIIPISSFSSLGGGSEDALFNINLEMMEQLKQRQKIKVVAKEGFATEDPDLLIFRKIIKKNLIANPLDALLKDIAKYDGQAAKLNKEDVLRRQQMQQIARTDEGFGNQEELLDEMNEGAPEEAGMTYNEVRQLVTKHYDQFRECYESALIGDELLSGNINVLLGGRVDVSFRGVGQSGSIKKLKNCIEQVSRSIDLPQELTGKRVKFSLFFKS